MQCVQCGSWIGPTDQTCPKCGTAVVPQMSAPPAAPDPSAQPAARDPWAIPPPGSVWTVSGYESPATYQPPAQPYGYAAHPRARQAGNGFSIAGIVCGALAFVICPIVLGPAGLLFARSGRKRGESLADTARWISTIGMICGFILGAWMYSRV